MAALLGAVFAALAQVFVRKLVHTEQTAAIVFYFSLTASILSLADAAVRLGGADARARRRCWSAPACSAGSGRSC